MNADCAWPPEAPTRLDLTNGADRRHLVVDTELIADLVDRYRFHMPNDQAACEQRLIDVVARRDNCGDSLNEVNSRLRLEESTYRETVVLAARAKMVVCATLPQRVERYDLWRPY